jgi:hypothetical protein
MKETTTTRQKMKKTKDEEEHNFVLLLHVPPLFIALFLLLFVFLVWWMKRRRTRFTFRVPEPLQQQQQLLHGSTNIGHFCPASFARPRPNENEGREGRKLKDVFFFVHEKCETTLQNKEQHFNHFRLFYFNDFFCLGCCVMIAAAAAKYSKVNSTSFITFLISSRLLHL